MKERLMKKFEELFGSTEDAGFYFSPGRVNLIEEQIWGKERRAWNRHTNTPIK